MFSASVTVDYPERIKPKPFAVLPLIEKLAHNKGKLHDHAHVHKCPELIEQVDAGHKMGELEQAVINFDCETGGNADAAKQFADELVSAFANFQPLLPPEDLQEFFTFNDGRLYAYVVVNVNGYPVEKRLAIIKLTG